MMAIFDSGGQRGILVNAPAVLLQKPRVPHVIGFNNGLTQSHRDNFQLLRLSKCAPESTCL
jgi:hypothetical protein